MVEQKGFGSWLKGQRLARGVTQAELAEALNYSVETIHKIEAGNRRPSKQLAALLAEWLSIALPERSEFIRFARGLPGATAPLLVRADGASHAYRLPVPLTTFIGREDMVATICHYLSGEQGRLLTLKGPPGIGKTRLGLQVAAKMEAIFAGRICVVELAPLEEPELVPSAVAQALGVREAGEQALINRLAQFLQSKQLLLLLDNFEQVLDAAPMVTTLLERCPGLKVVVTSREALHMYGEQVIAVPPLSLPELEPLPSLSALCHCEAVALFLQRARAVQADFELTEANAHAVAAICVRLDGLPLAIELAAAQVTLFPPDALLARLENRLALLVSGARNLPPRQRTLRKAIEWSYHLLDEGERVLLRRLAVFIGSCTLEAVEAVCNADGDLPLTSVAGVASLISKSLLGQISREGEPRLTMLETIHEYAWERLLESGELESTRRHHTLYYLALISKLEPDIYTLDNAEVLERLAGEHDNLRAALQWCKERGESDLELSLVAGLIGFWRIHGHLQEGRQWMERVLSRTSSAAPNRRRAKVLLAAGTTAWQQGDYQRAWSFLEASVAAWRAVGDRGGLAQALQNLGIVAAAQGQREAYWDYNNEALRLWREVNDQGGIAQALCNLGLMKYEADETSRARALLKEGLVAARQSGIEWIIAHALLNLARVVRQQGDLDGAAALLDEGFLLLKLLRYQWLATYALEEVAGLIAVKGKAEQAAQLLGAAEAMRRTISAPRLPFEHAHYDRDVAALRQQLDGATFARTWAAGRSMTVEQAFDLAIQLVTDK